MIPCHNSAIHILKHASSFIFLFFTTPLTQMVILKFVNLLTNPILRREFFGKIDKIPRHRFHPNRLEFFFVSN